MLVHVHEVIMGKKSAASRKGRSRREYREDNADMAAGSSSPAVRERSRSPPQQVEVDRLLEECRQRQRKHKRERSPTRRYRATTQPKCTKEPMTINVGGETINARHECVEYKDQDPREAPRPVCTYRRAMFVLQNGRQPQGHRNRGH